MMIIQTKYDLGDKLVDNAGCSGVVTGMKAHNFDGRLRIFYYLDHELMEYYEEHLEYAMSEI